MPRGRWHPTEKVKLVPWKPDVCEEPGVHRAPPGLEPGRDEGAVAVPRP